MNVRRLVLALVIAIVISGGLTLWLSRRIAKSHAAASAALQYVVTTRKMDAGEVLKPEDVRQVRWPGSMSISGAITKPQEAIGRAVLYPLASGEPLQEGQLAAPGAGLGLSAKIPEGMRALSLKSDQVVGVSGFLLPGTHVDVLVTYHSAASPSPVTSTVLQNAEILAAGQKTEPDPQGKPTQVDVVTLLVSPQDAQKVVLASTQGRVQLVLRNGSDNAQVTVQPMQMSALGEVSDAKPLVTKPKVQRVTVSAPKPYSIEIVNGDKATKETFQ
ncbi:MAG: Flp pilus assembly protein CpaB [Bacillota bacterium]|nr:Flp pilus assembly protein CpaB [Bacillota bacterium]